MRLNYSLEMTASNNASQDLLTHVIVPSLPSCTHIFACVNICVFGHEFVCMYVYVFMCMYMFKSQFISNDATFIPLLIKLVTLLLLVVNLVPYHMSNVATFWERYCRKILRILHKTMKSDSNKFWTDTDTESRIKIYRCVWYEIRTILDHIYLEHVTR